MPMDFTELLGRQDHEPRVDIVTVHGLHRAGKEPWEDTDSRPKWLEKGLLEKSDVRVIVFNYEEELDNGLAIYTKQGCILVAQRLIDSLISWRLPNDESCRPLAFISHDIGGIIVKQGLLLALKQYERYKSILQSLYAMVFINCPHRPANHAALFDSIVALMCNTRASTSGIFEIVKNLCSTIIITNDEFADSTVFLHTRVTNVYSKHSERSSRVFDENTATLGLACETPVSLSGTHATLLVGEEGKSSHNVLKKTLEFSTDDGNGITVWPVPESQQGLWLLNPSLIVSPHCRSGEQQGPASALQFSDFIQWMQQKVDFHRARWILTSEDHSVPINSFNSLLQKWEEDPNQPKAFMFTCDLANYRSPPHNRDEDEYVTGVILATLLSQAISYLLPRTEPTKRPQNVLDRLENSHVLSDYRPLLDLFMDVNLWLKDSNIQAIWGIWNIHKFPHKQQSLVVQTLTKCFEFSEFKPPIIFISQDDSGQQLSHTMEEAGVPRFEQVSTYEKLAGRIHTLEVGKQQSFLLGRTNIRHLFEKAIQRINTPSFINILTCWTYNALENELASRTAERKIASILEEVYTKPSRLFQIIIESLPQDQRKRTLEILRWVACSFQPLSPHQLAEALSTDIIKKEETSRGSKPNDENDHFYFIYGILLELPQRLYYMLEIEHNEIQLSHFNVSELLSTDTFKAGIDLAEAHLHIFECLLLRISVQASSLPLVNSQVPPSFPRPYDLTWYAVHYWPQHYIIAKEHESTAQRADEYLQKFLKSQRRAVKYWLHLSGGLTSPFFASNNQALVENLMVSIRSSLYKMDTTRDVFECRPWIPDVAIVELVRCGDLDRLMTISFDSLNQQQVRQILEESTKAHATVETMEYLFQQAKDRAPLPFSFLTRLVQVGATDSVKIACKTQRPSLDEHGMLLLTAVQSRQKETTKMLLKLDNISSNHGILEAVKKACQIGDPIELQLILEVTGLEYRHTTLLHDACVRGNHLAVDALLREFDFDNSDHMAQLQESSALTTSVLKGFTKCTLAILEQYNVNNHQQELRDAITIALNSANPAKATCQILFDTGVTFSEEHIPQLFQEAIQKGRLDLVELISDRCGGINAVNWEDMTPLHMASFGGHASIVEHLLEIGADINARDDGGITPIYGACVKNHPRVVSLLLARGADVTIASDNNWSPLEASYDLPDLMKMLVTNASPPPDYKRITTGTKDYTAFWLAVKHNHIESVRILLDHGDPDLEFAPSGEDTGVRLGMTALAYAAWNGLNEILRLLLDKGANINHRVPGSGGSYPLLHGVGNDSTMAILLEYKHNLEATDFEGRSVLNYWAQWASESQLSILGRLINAGANLESESIFYHTPLSNAASDNNAASVKFLVSRGAQINTLRPKYGGPLHRAAQFSKVDMVKMLIGMGADLNREHNMVGSPLQAACTALNDKDIAEYLVGELGAETNTAGSVTRTVFGQACRTGSLEVVRYLLDNGATPTTVGRSGIPCIFNLCVRKNSAVEVLEELLSRDVPVWTQRDCLGRNILHQAVMGENKKLVEKILEGHPNLLQEKDNDGWTALHWAARQARIISEENTWLWPSKHKRRAIVELLLEKECPGVGERVVAGKRRWAPSDIAGHHEEPRSVLEAFSVEDYGVYSHPEQPYDSEWNCDCCFAQVKGVLHRCKAEVCYSDFGLCFKCYPYKDLCHDTEHEFEEVGKDFQD